MSEHFGGNEHIKMSITRAVRIAMSLIPGVPIGNWSTALIITFLNEEVMK